MPSPSKPRQSILDFDDKTFLPSCVVKPSPYAEGNALAAGIILADPSRYGGSQALPVEWARLFTSHAERSN